jgi:hypothetical protein
LGPQGGRLSAFWGDIDPPAEGGYEERTGKTEA